MEKHCLHLGNNIDYLQRMEDCSVHAIVTDPPYGLRMMGKTWDYSVPSVELWQACLRVLRPGGHLLSFAGTRTYHRMAVNIEDAGFEIRDMISWVYGEGMPKSHNVSRVLESPESEQWDGWGTNLKPAFEPIVVARKPIESNIAENVQKWQAGVINIDATRIPTDDSLVSTAVKRTDNVVFGKGLGFGVQQEPGGRWPANFTHDGSPEVLELFPVTTPAKKANRGKGIDGPTFKNKNGETSGVRGHNDSGGSAARFFYCAKASRKERELYLEDYELKIGGSMEGTRNQSLLSNGKIRNNLRHNHHPTVKPIALMDWLVKLVTPPGGIVLDPFMGSGTTGIAAILNDFRFVGIELDPEYFEIALGRIKGWTGYEHLHREVQSA